MRSVAWLATVGPSIGLLRYYKGTIATAGVGVPAVHGFQTSALVGQPIDGLSPRLPASKRRLILTSMDSEDHAQSLTDRLERQALCTPDA